MEGIMQNTVSLSHFDSTAVPLFNPNAQQVNIVVAGPSSSTMPSKAASNDRQAIKLPPKPPAPLSTNLSKSSSNSLHSTTYLNKYARAEPKVQSKTFDPAVDLIDLSDNAPPASVQTVSTKQNDTKPTQAPLESRADNDGINDARMRGKRLPRSRRNERTSTKGRKPKQGLGAHPKSGTPQGFSGLPRRSENEAEVADEEIPYSNTSNENEISNFYRSVDSVHRKKQCENTLFTLPLTALSHHNNLLHRNMHLSLVSSDPAVLSGFNLCNDTAQRLLKRATNTDVAWAAQLQRMQDAYEAELAEQKRLAEKQLQQMQAEVERWQERCEGMRSSSRKK